MSGDNIYFEKKYTLHKKCTLRAQIPDPDSSILGSEGFIFLFDRTCTAKFTVYFYFAKKKKKEKTFSNMRQLLLCNRFYITEYFFLFFLGKFCEARHRHAPVCGGTAPGSRPGAHGHGTDAARTNAEPGKPPVVRAARADPRGTAPPFVSPGRARGWGTGWLRFHTGELFYSGVFF